MKTNDKALEIQLGSNLKAERKRLGLSTSEVAYHCQTSTVSIWNWETGKVKIPLNAIAKLVAFGFDVGKIIPEPEAKEVRLRLAGSPRGVELGVAWHFLVRCEPVLKELQDWSCMCVYHNPEWVGSRSPIAPGSLCLVDVCCVQRFEGVRIEDLWTGIFLLRSPVTGKYSLAEFVPQSKNAIQIRAGNAAEKANLADVQKSFPRPIEGKVLGVVGNSPPESTPHNEHGKALTGVMKAIRRQK